MAQARIDLQPYGYEPTSVTTDLYSHAMAQLFISVQSTCEFFPSFTSSTTPSFLFLMKPTFSIFIETMIQMPLSFRLPRTIIILLFRISTLYLPTYAYNWIHSVISTGSLLCPHVVLGHLNTIADSVFMLSPISLSFLLLFQIPSNSIQWVQINYIKSNINNIPWTLSPFMGTSDMEHNR